MNIRQGENRRQLYLEFVLVVIFFVIPIFALIGIGDVEIDEAIYSFASDQILRDGDWLTPKAIYEGQPPFLEKPPLKFWLVAVGIKLGLPTTNWGHRFFDACFASFTLFYIFLLGNRMAGPWAGLASVLVFFGFKSPLLFHGLLNNNMESCILLQCAGSIFHFNAWAEGRGRTGWHVLALSILFVLAFMTKFVAAFLLPASLFAVMCLHRGLWRRLAKEWALWFVGLVFTFSLIAPWFVYQHFNLGDSFWRVIFGEHIFQRMIHGLSGQIQPWYYYAKPIGRMIERGPGPVAFVAIVYFAATRWRSASVLDTLTAVWFIVPVILISAMRSKGIHYVYPFLPPLALVTGVFITRVWSFRTPGWTQKGAVRWALRTVMILSLLVGLWTAHSGTAIVTIGDTVILKNSSVVRPLALGASIGVSAFLPRSIPLMLALCLPLSGYPDVLKDMHARSETFMTLQSCLSEVAGDTKVRAYFGKANSAHHAFSFYRVVEYADWNPEHVEMTLFGEKPRAVWVSQAQYRTLLARPDASRLSHLPAHHMPAAVIYAGPDQTKIEVALLILPRPFDKCDESLRRAGSKRL